MNIFIDGYQNVGKTQMLEKCKYKHTRFPFNQYLDKFNLKTKEELNGFQIGKDLGILFTLSQVQSKEILLFDRGPFSTLYYSLKEKRWKKGVDQFNDFLGELTKFKGCAYIFVVKINSQSLEREHNDGFDYLNDEQDPQKFHNLEVLQQMALTWGLPFYIFENDFSKPIDVNVDRFNEFVKNVVRELVHEHNRN